MEIFIFFSLTLPGYFLIKFDLDYHDSELPRLP